MESTIPLELGVADTAPRLRPFEALLGVIVRPYQTFVRMREAPVGYWWVAFIVAIIGLLMITAATVPIEAEATRAEFEASQEQLEGLSEEEQASAEQVQNIFTSQLLLGALGFVAGLIGILINYAIRAGLLYLLGLAFGGRASWRQVWRMAVWTTLPEALRRIVSAIAVFATGNPPASGLTYILSPQEIAEASPILIAFLTNIDLYTIWSLVLVTIGLIATYQISKGKSVLITFIYWLIGMIFILGGAGILTAMGSAFGPGG